MLEADDDSTRYWFYGDLDEAENFKVFAIDNCGGLFCFWNYSDAKSPLETVKKAIEHHPDLFAYIEQWQEKKYGA